MSGTAHFGMTGEMSVEIFILFDLDSCYLANKMLYEFSTFDAL